MATFKITDIPGTPIVGQVTAGLTYRNAIILSGLDYMGKKIVCRSAGISTGYNLQPILDREVQPNDFIYMVGAARGSGPPLPDDFDHDTDFLRTMAKYLNPDP